MRQKELIRKNEFIVVVLDPEDEILIFHVTSLAISDMSKVYSFFLAQIIFMQVNEPCTTVFL